MAKLGEKLWEAEAGWKRIDDTDPCFTYPSGLGLFAGRPEEYFSGTVHYNWNNAEGSIKFNFTGTKLRIIARNAHCPAHQHTIAIDGNVENMYIVPMDSGECIIAYEKTGLANSEHAVEIVLNGGGFGFDAIDIDEKGEVKPHNPNAQLSNPQNPDIKEDCLLKVRMIDSSEIEFQLSAVEVEGFIAWFNRPLGTGTTCYGLNKKVGSRSSKEYLGFDKIVNFEVAK